MLGSEPWASRMNTTPRRPCRTSLKGVSVPSSAMSGRSSSGRCASRSDCAGRRQSKAMVRSSSATRSVCEAANWLPLGRRVVVMTRYVPGSRRMRAAPSVHGTSPRSMVEKSMPYGVRCSRLMVQSTP